MQYQITMTMTAPVKHKSDANVFTQDYVYDRYHMLSHSGGSLFPLLNDCSRACDAICSCIKMLWAMMYKWCISMQAVSTVRTTGHATHGEVAAHFCLRL